MPGMIPFCLLDEKADTEMGNWGVFWDDVIQFFEQQNELHASMPKSSDIV
jgi:hypothetical protein